MKGGDERAAVDALFAGDGEMRARGRAMDWSTTLLGPVHAWPSALRTGVRLMLDAPLPTSLWCGAGYTLLYNDAYRAILGGKHPAALGRSGAEVWAELWPELAPQFAGVMDGGGATFAEESHLRVARCGDGTAEDACFTYALSALTGESGARLAVWTVAMEVTPQVRARLDAEQKLAASESARALVEGTTDQLQEQQVELELLNAQLQDNAAEMEAANEELQATAAELEERTREAELERARADGILQSMADAHFVLDADFRFLSANPAMEQGGGIARDALLGHTIWEMFPGAVGTVWEHNYRRVVADGVPVHFTHDYSDGRLELVVDADAYPTADGGIAVFWRDVTERARTEAALRASETQLRTLADAIPTLAWTARADGYIDWYNARWYEYTGTTPADMEGWGWQSVHDPAELPWVLATWQAGIASGEPVDFTFPLRGADGCFRRFLTRIVPVRDGEGRVLRWFGTNTDVEAERLAREAAEHANQAKTDFLATMSHELRTPLNAIAGYAELMQLGIHGPVSEPQAEALHRIQRSQRHLLGLINDVLNFAKLEAGHVVYRLHDVAVREAVDNLEPLVAPQLQGKALRFTRDACTDAAGAALVVRADPDKVRQVLLNLLSNAIKFTAEGGAIAVRCTGRDGVVSVAVTDTGIGVAPERLEDVFAPFVQIERRLNAPYEGTGLGLAISRDLARAMGGDLLIESTPGVGSTFTLTLPRA